MKWYHPITSITIHYTNMAAAISEITNMFEFMTLNERTSANI